MILGHKSFVLAAALALAAGAAGCSGSKDKPMGGATVSVSSAAVIADIQSIKVTIDDHGVAPTFAPIDFFLTKGPAGNVWTGSITQIPADPAPGSQRRFKAEAFDGPNATGVKRYEGDALAVVIARQTASVTILLQELNVPPGPTNFAPVITSLTSTAAYVLPGQRGSSSVSAIDPDHNGEPLAYQWSATCTGGGTLALATPTAATTAWTAPTVNSVCTVAIHVSETGIAQPLSVTTYFTITVNANFGDANVAVYPNSFPIVTARGDFRYNFFSDVTTIPVGQQGDLFFTAIDPDGDNVQFNLSVRCKDDTTTPPTPWADLSLATLSASALTTTSGGTVSPPAPSGPFAFNPTWGYPAPAVAGVSNPYADCEFKIDVQDLCTAGNCGAAGAQGSLPDGAPKVTTINGVQVRSVTTGLIDTTHPARARRAPVMVRTIAPNQLGPAAASVQTWDPQQMAIVQPGGTYLLQAEADDRYEGGALQGSYSCANGTFVPGPVHSGNLKDSILWTAPSPLTIGMQCTITFTSGGPSGSNLSTVATFEFAGSDPCVGQADGTVCNDGNACTSGDRCVSGVCTALSALTCTALDQCHDAGVCDPLSGVCSNPNRANGAACSDGNACTNGDVCSAGVCAAGAPAVCTASDQCHLAGVCDPASGACSNPVAANGTTCSDGNLCTTSDVCTAGACGGAPVSCAPGECILTAGTCNPANGLCQGGVNQPDGTACTPDSSLCTNDVCAGGVCSHPSACTAGQSCDPAVGCQNSTVVNQSLTSADLARIDGLAGSGTSSYLSGTGVFNPAKTVFGVSLNGAGASESFLAKFDTTTGLPVWTKIYGDDLDQFGADNSAETLDGTVAVIGRLAAAGRIGECTPGATVTCTGVVVSNTNAFESDFLMLVNATTGAVKTGTQVVNNGLSGKLTAVTANPALNRIAVCGVVSGATSSLCRTPAASADSCTAATAYQSGTDLLVAMFDTAGTLLWARQVGGTPGVTSDESCNSVTIDVDGTVWMAGKYMENLNLGGSSSPLPTLPALTSTRHTFVAHFSPTGATLAAQSYGQLANRCTASQATACTVATQATDCAGLVPATCNATTGGNVTPNTLRLDGTGNLVLGGSFTASFPVGGLVSAGGTDAFVAKLAPTLAPIWGVRLGNTGSDQTNAVAIAPLDSVIAVGSYSAVVSGTATTGAAALTAPSGTAGQAFIMKLDANTGATHFAGGYGDAAVQLGTDLAVNGSRVHWAGSYLGTLDMGGGLTLTNPGTSSLGFEVFANIQ